MDTIKRALIQSWSKEKDFNKRNLLLNDTERAKIREYENLLINILEHDFSSEVVIDINTEANLEIFFKGLTYDDHTGIGLRVSLDMFIHSVVNFEKAIYNLALATSALINEGKNFELIHNKWGIKVMYNDTQLLSIDKKVISLYDYDDVKTLTDYMNKTCKFILGKSTE